MTRSPALVLTLLVVLTTVPTAQALCVNTATIPPTIGPPGGACLPPLEDAVDTVSNIVEAQVDRAEEQGEKIKDQI